MIYSVGSTSMASTQSFGAFKGKGSKAKRAGRIKCHIEDAIEGLGKQVNMNRYKQINMAKIERQQKGTQPVFFSPYTPTGLKTTFVK